MKYGICPLTVVPLRGEPRDASEMVSQVLYGECFEVLQKEEKWSLIRLTHDLYEGWIDNKQYNFINNDQFDAIKNQPDQRCIDFIAFATDPQEQLIPLTFGAKLNALSYLQHQFDGELASGIQSKNRLTEIALIFLNAPYLWGGRTPFGIDCSGFTQIVYLLCGHSLLRDASQQATQGKVLSFIEESEPGDLAFFDNEEGRIIHVGIILKNNHIIHAHGKVRIDQLDHTGIFNSDTSTYSHQLRLIKKIF
ncbi:C40 family peptidase [Aquimarina sp. ERC-38]|uniref:C40 family peptidase n=1 Tax=Aquimarina sp. ERC-38 TaxID=2949996 RepID=UPI0022483BC3|nr:C40 family peptidase [Aquimarina sp. ERC-38]UZO80212.1 C40 family peptidase [Aquimarina sp. ERC-38]